MGRTIQAVYERGVLRPLEDPGLEEHQKVVIQVVIERNRGSEEAADSTLRGWQEILADCSEDEVADLESLMLDRSRFMPPER